MSIFIVRSDEIFVVSNVLKEKLGTAVTSLLNVKSAAILPYHRRSGFWPQLSFSRSRLRSASRRLTINQYAPRCPTLSEVRSVGSTKAVLFFCMTRRSISSYTPVPGGVCLPESCKCCITINVDDNNIRAAAVFSKTVTASKVSSGPAVPCFNPSFKPFNIFKDIRPTLRYFLRVRFVLALLVNCNLQLHYCYSPYRGTFDNALEIWTHINPFDRHR